MRKGVNMKDEVRTMLIDKLEQIRPGVYWRIDNERDDETSPTKNSDGTWNVTVHTGDSDGAPGLQFKELDKLAEIFKTKEINWTKESRSEGYCDSCYESWEALVIELKHATI